MLFRYLGEVIFYLGDFIPYLGEVIYDGVKFYLSAAVFTGFRNFGYSRSKTADFGRLSAIQRLLLLILGLNSS